MASTVPPSNKTESPKRRKSLRKRLLLAAGSVLVAVILVEVLLRVAGVSYPLPYVPDRHLGTRLQPGFAARFQKEGAANVRVNREGFRDVDHTIEKPARTYRVAVLGDSYAEAVQVPLAMTFWKILEGELATCGTLTNHNIEVLNFGVSGYGTAQELLALRHYALKYDPDLVLLAFTPGNDVRNNSKALEPVQARPFFVLRDGDLVLDESFRDHPDYLTARSDWTKFKVGLINRSRILQVVNEWKNAPREQPVGEPGEAGLASGIYREPESDDWREAWRVTEALLRRMHAESRAAGVDFIVATISEGTQVHPDPQVRKQFRNRLGVDDLFYAERRIQAVGAEAGFPVINLGRPLREIAEERDLFLHGFENTTLGEGHWNIDGHRFAGELLAEEICSFLNR